MRKFIGSCIVAIAAALPAMEAAAETWLQCTLVEQGDGIHAYFRQSPHDRIFVFDETAQTFGEYRANRLYPCSCQSCIQNNKIWPAECSRPGLDTQVDMDRISGRITLADYPPVPPGSSVRAEDMRWERGSCAKIQPLPLAPRQF